MKARSSSPLIRRKSSAFSRKKGQTLVEFSLILAMMGILAVGVFTLLSARIKILFSVMAQILDTAQTPDS